MTSRRRFLATLAAAPLARRLRAGMHPIFEEIPPERSGITWVHENARTAEHYLPETLPPGCAIFALPPAQPVIVPPASPPPPHALGPFPRRRRRRDQQFRTRQSPV